MQSHALAIVFGPTLFQTDGQDYSAGRAIEDLIEHYKLIFQVWANLGTRHLDYQPGTLSLLDFAGPP